MSYPAFQKPELTLQFIFFDGEEAFVRYESDKVEYHDVVLPNSICLGLVFKILLQMDQHRLHLWLKSSGEGLGKQGKFCCIGVGPE